LLELTTGNGFCNGEEENNEIGGVVPAALLTAGKRKAPIQQPPLPIDLPSKKVQ
jgi:hypothetical protein